MTLKAKKLIKSQTTVRPPLAPDRCFAAQDMRRAPARSWVIVRSRIVRPHARNGASRE